MKIAAIIALLLMVSPNSYGNSISKNCEYDRNPNTCLACNIYHEGRGENFNGQVAIGIVTINRVKSLGFPGTICNVVWEHKQFSWTFDGKSDKPVDNLAWNRAAYIAHILLTNNYIKLEKLQKALYFHNASVKPSWSKSKKYIGRIGDHFFYE